MNTLIMSKKLKMVVMTVFIIVTIVQGMGLIGSNAYAEDAIDPDGSNAQVMGPTPIIVGEDVKVTYTSGGKLFISPTVVPIKKKAVILMDASLDPLNTPPPSNPFDYAIFSDNNVSTSGSNITINGSVRTNVSADITAGGFTINNYTDENGKSLTGKLQYVEEINKGSIQDSKFIDEQVTETIEIEQGLADEYLKNPDKYNVMEFDLVNKTYTNAGITKNLTKPDLGTQNNILKQIDEKKYGNLTLSDQEENHGMWNINSNSGGDFDIGDENGKINVWYFKPGLKISVNSVIKGKGVIITDGDMRIEGAGIDGEILIYSRGGNINISTDAKMKKAVIYAPNGNVTLQGSNFQMDGAIIGKNVTTQMTDSSITYSKVSVVKDTPKTPVIDENIKAAAKDFVKRITNSNLEVNFISYKGDAGGVSYTDPTVYTKDGVNNKDALLKFIDGTNTDPSEVRGTYANLGDGLRRAYYILEDDDEYSRYVIVLSSGVVKGWTERNNTSEDSDFSPYKTQAGAAMSFGDTTNSADHSMSYAYAKYFGEKLKDEGISTSYLQLANLDTVKTLENMVVDIYGDTNQYYTGTNVIPDTLFKSVNEEETKPIDKIYIKSISIHEDYKNTDNISIQRFEGDSSSGWKEGTTQNTFTGDFKKGLGAVQISNGSFPIKPDTADAIIQFSKPGSVTIEKDIIGTDVISRYIKYSYVYMDGNKYIDEKGEYHKDINEVTAKEYSVALDKLKFEVKGVTISGNAEVWISKSVTIDASNYIVGDVNKDKYEFTWYKDTIWDEVTSSWKYGNYPLNIKNVVGGNPSEYTIESTDSSLDDAKIYKVKLKAQKPGKQPIEGYINVIVKKLAFAKDLVIWEGSKATATLNVLADAAYAVDTTGYKYSYDPGTDISITKAVDGSSVDADTTVVNVKCDKAGTYTLSATVNDGTKDAVESAPATCTVTVKELLKDTSIAIEDMIVGDVAYINLDLNGNPVVGLDNITKKIELKEINGMEHNKAYFIDRWEIVGNANNTPVLVQINGKNYWKVQGDCVDLLYEESEPRMCKVVAKKRATGVKVEVIGRKVEVVSGAETLAPLSGNIIDDFKISTDIN